MPKLHATLEPGDVVLIPAGQGGSVQFVEKSGRRSRVVIECSAPVTITRASERSSAPAPAPQRFAPRPKPNTG